jgi:hypothetical protein
VIDGQANRRACPLVLDLLIAQQTLAIFRGDLSMTRLRVTAVCMLALSVLAAGTAAADDLQVTVKGIGTPAPSLKLNGNQTTQGTIQLFYTVTDYAFPVGPFAQFSIDMIDVHLAGANGSYNAPLTLKQNGSQTLVLTPDQTNFTVTGVGWTGSTVVQITVPDGVSNDDGTDLVGNLNMNVPGPNHVGTPTTIQVHVRLVHPTACLKVYNFITDAEVTQIVDAATITVKKGSVKSSQPGQFADDVLIANTCLSTQSFDLGIALDSRFEMNPNNNPGNAVFAYSTSGEIDPTTFSIQSFGTGTANGHQLCLQNVTMPANTSFLATVHSQVIKGQSSATLGSSPFGFSADLRTAASSCGGALDSMATPNPVAATLPFTIN